MTKKEGTSKGKKGKISVLGERMGISSWWPVTKTFPKDDLKKNLWVLAILSMWCLTITFPLATDMGKLLHAKKSPMFLDTDYLHFFESIRRKSSYYENSPLAAVRTVYMSHLYFIVGILVTYHDVTDVVVFNNIFFLASMVSGGFFMYLYVKKYLDCRYCGVFAGLAFMSSNYIFHQYNWGHPNYFQIQWIPLTFYLVEIQLRRFDLKLVALTVATLVLQLASAYQYALYLLYVVTAYIALRFTDKNIMRKSGFFLLGILLVSTAILPPAYLTYFKSQRQPYELSYIGQIKSWSLVTFSEVYGNNSHKSLGTVLVSLMLLGLLLYLKNIRKSGTLLLPQTVLIPVLVWLMRGTYIQPSLYSFVHTHLPLFGFFRVPIRFFPFLDVFALTVAAYPIRLFRRKKAVVVSLFLFLLIVFQLSYSGYFTSRQLVDISMYL